MHLVSLWVFCVARFLHTFFYVHPKQPICGIVWILGFFATFVTAGNAVFAVASL